MIQKSTDGRLFSGALASLVGATVVIAAILFINVVSIHADVRWRAHTFHVLDAVKTPDSALTLPRAD
jgi:membrane protein YdbS with pleckstrin-like domain